MPAMLGSCAVFVNGFDFGTTQEAVESHFSEAGLVESVEMKKGSAVVTFSSSSEAEAAVDTLNKSTIEGNSRFVAVKLDRKSLPHDEAPPKPAKRKHVGPEAVCEVFVFGFDFGTTQAAIEAHFSDAGLVESVDMKKSNAVVTFSSPSEAEAAVDTLNKTTIEGNSRYIDVRLDQKSMPPTSDGDRPGKFQKSGGSARAATEVVPPWLRGKEDRGSARAATGGGKAKGKGKGKGKRGDHRDEDPPGAGRVFVRGFDIGTTDEELEGHMSAAGALHTVHWVSRHSAVVVFKKRASAEKAASKLDKTTIEGNGRYMDIILKD